MSLLVTCFVNDGIVMASDSLIAYNQLGQPGSVNETGMTGIPTIPQAFVEMNAQKLFICGRACGIAVGGEACFRGKPIEITLREFCSSVIEKDLRVDDIAWKLLDYFTGEGNPPKTNCIVAGYQDGEQKIYKIRLADKSCEVINAEKCGAVWDGDVAILSKLLKPVYVKSNDGRYIQLPFSTIPWQFFSIQDACDYVRYAVKLVADTMRFESGPVTVGGNVDILLIKNGSAEWISKKEIK